MKQIDDTRRGEAVGGGFLAELRQLGRMLLFRAPRTGVLVPDPVHLLVVVLLFAALSLGVQVAEQGYPGSVEWEAFGSLLSPFAGAALAAALAAVAARRRQLAGGLMVAFSLLLLLYPLRTVWTEQSFAALVTGLGIETQGGPSMLLLALYYLPQLWLIAAAAVAAWRLAGAAGGVRAAAGFAVVLAMGGNFWLHAQVPELWFAALEPRTPKPRLRIDENVLYGQPRLLERQLAAIRPGQPGVPELFFVGVGGYAPEDVFLREVRSVAQLFDERFGTAGRSTVLVNNAATAHALPVANRESLARTLKQVGARMNGDEDLLFLFLTSHGSRNHRFSLAHWPFEFEDITPQSLRQALDEAGIRRKVVVISACYSGGFVPALENDDTLVITAAAADRNSFGCADENEFTDFGRAYFQEALRETRSFTEAFERARSRVAEREQAEGLTPSLPQMGGGAALVPLLEHFARTPVAAEAPAPALAAVPASADPYRRIALALAQPAQDRRLFEVCLAALTDNSPAAQLARDRSAFNGLEQDAYHWGRYVEAWERYASDYCVGMNDRERLSGLWARSWRAAVPAHEAAGALADWLEAPSSRDFLQAYREAFVEEARLLSDLSLQTQREAEQAIIDVSREIRAAYEARQAGGAAR